MCELFGKSRQAYYQKLKYNYKEVLKDQVIIEMVNDTRLDMPKIGGRKLYNILSCHLHGGLQMGRDVFFELLRSNNLLIRRKRRSVRTTYSNHWLRKYPNLIRSFTPTAPNQLWVSDITFIKTEVGFVFLSLVIDAYSRKIVGWSIGDTLEAKHSIAALLMAIKHAPKDLKGLIHHSDRGVQYCSDGYVRMLSRKGISISMTESGDPLENAIAERVNGILKTEWLYLNSYSGIEDAKRAVKSAIWTYNNLRPHLSLGMETPENVHLSGKPVTKMWKNYYRNMSFEKVDNRIIFDSPTK